MGRAVATGRLLPRSGGSAKIGRMAVHRAARLRLRRTGPACTGGAGAGARDRAIELHAQRTASDFYARLGFVPQGEPFEEAGIPHIAMTSALPLRR